ncbi:SUZ domain-containing protein 1 [Phlebotomus argentipes]|uniref:SUZ domain-containing protein 1 n=1 Tax=Phlebotomus argentipes TaxID=94469 RepID=UPI002892BC8D|nr:SUZ domain-containing protein 1 [Phlebotomus argentipes]
MSRKQEDVLDSWEEIDEAQLTAKINKMREHSSKDKNSRKMTILAVEDDPRSHFGQFGPSEPTLKILKRPQDGGGTAGGDVKPKAPVKSLQQREQEYAEARLRILGCAKSPEDEQNNTVMRRGSEGGGGGGGSTSRQAATKTPDGLIRLPRGPDGTCGFTLRR